MASEAVSGVHESRSVGPRFTVRFDEGEATSVKRAASARGLSTAALIRASVLDGIKGEMVPRSVAVATVDSAESEGVGADAVRELREARVAVNRAGVNMNQIARRLNKGTAVTLGATEARAFDELREALHAVEQALGGVRRS